MPSLVMFPFIQCHQTRGRAPLGGFSNPLLSGSAEACPHAAPAPKTSRANEVVRSLLHAHTMSSLLVVGGHSGPITKTGQGCAPYRTRHTVGRERANYRSRDLRVSRKINDFSNELLIWRDGYF